MLKPRAPFFAAASGLCADRRFHGSAHLHFHSPAPVQGSFVMPVHCRRVSADATHAGRAHTSRVPRLREESPYLRYAAYETTARPAISTPAISTAHRLAAGEGQIVHLRHALSEFAAHIAVTISFDVLQLRHGADRIFGELPAAQRLRLRPLIRMSSTIQQPRTNATI